MAEKYAKERREATGTISLIGQCLEMGLTVRIENFVTDPACFVIDHDFHQKGCAQLRGESWLPRGYSTPATADEIEMAIRNACLQAVHHEHPADPEHPDFEPTPDHDGPATESNAGRR